MTRLQFGGRKRSNQIKELTAAPHLRSASEVPKYLIDNSTNTPKPSSESNGASPAPPRALALGSKQRANIPMTPRSVGLGRSDFQRQLAERNRVEKPQKKSKSSVPKGSKLAEGYTDRAKARMSEEEDERAVRIKALEEALKNEEIDQETFEKLRSEIAGGDLSSTHLIKGLDRKLLERVRKGEDVFGEGKPKKDDADSEQEEEEDVDEALDQLEETKVDAITREKTVKKGQLSTGGPKPGQKRTRDMILAEMKAAREAAKAKAESALGSKFKKIGANKPGTSRIERDSKGREVLIIVDEDGHEKRKVRKIQPGAEEAESNARDLMMPDKNAKPLGMEVPDIYKSKQEEAEDEDVDIFDGVGDDYDPLAGLDEDEDDSDEEGEADKPVKPATEKADLTDRESMPPPTRPISTSESRNYFKDSKSALVSSETLKAPSMSDPTIVAALKKAASLNPLPRASDEDDDEVKAKAERHRRMLQNEDRDAEDMDMGFGTSRFEDEADFDDTQIKLSKWGDGDDDDEGAGGGGKSKRKRRGKKRKGDANNVADVMRVIEQRKAAG